MVAPAAGHDEKRGALAGFAAEHGGVVREVCVGHAGEGLGARVEGALHRGDDLVLWVGVLDVLVLGGCGSPDGGADRVVGLDDVKLHVAEGFLGGRRLEAVLVGGHLVGRGYHVLGPALDHLADGVGGRVLGLGDGREREQE